MKMFDTQLWGRVKTQIRDIKTGKIVSQSRWQKNLVMDAGLNALAQNSPAASLATLFAGCKVGDGTAPNKFASGAITFTQSGTTITASGTFFDVTMTGGLFKWGTGSGGVETYITFVDATHATADAAATVTTPSVATVWQVQQTTMSNFLYSFAAYDSSTGSNSTTYSGNTVTMKRTFVFASQATTYNVNEIGYYSSGSGSNVYGRIVLSASDTVAPSQYYVVIAQITYAVSPGSPAAVADVGTGFNTSGQAMWQSWHSSTVDSSGNATTAYTMDGRTNDDSFGVFIGTFPALNSSPATSSVSYASSDQFQLGTIPTPSHAGKPVGVCSSTLNFSISTSGQTCKGFILGLKSGSSTYASFLLELTTPVTLPTGSFSGTATFEWSFSRTLTN